MSRPFFAIVALATLFITTIHALPIHALPIQNTALVKRTNSGTIIGYRAVAANVAAQYNEHGTLTAVPASGKQIGEGAYLTATPGSWGGPTAWTCVVYADPAKWQHIPKLWIPAHDPHNPAIGLFYNDHNLDKYISEHAHMKPAETVLFSDIKDSATPTLQMLIPRGYLKGSHALLPGKHANSNLPDITIQCFPPGSKAVPMHPVEWDKWFIPGFGTP